MLDCKSVPIFVYFLFKLFEADALQCKATAKLPDQAIDDAVGDPVVIVVIANYTHDIGIEEELQGTLCILNWIV